MSSSSTKLLQKVLLERLNKWLLHINGKEGPRFNINTSKNTIVINQEMIIKIDAKAITQCASWYFPILTITLTGCLHLMTPALDKRSTTVDYSDPEYYRKILDVADRASKVDSIHQVEMVMKEKRIDA